MKKNFGDTVWRSLLFNSLVVSGVLIFKCDRAFSQVTPDDTLGDESSVVNTRDATSDSIDGGAVRGQNLFHSFEEFNVGEDRGVYFSNPEAVTDIFSRVTGNNVSNILGTLGVDGAANLFLINPNGIVFGEGASLDVQGSFTATTADGIEFDEQGFFSAVNPQDSVLTISVPLGLQFGSSPGMIINRSFVLDNTGDNVGLQVPAGENLTLVGGDVSFEAGEATARGGNIEIGGLGAAGTVAFNDDGGLSFPDNVAKADVSLSNAADADVRGTSGGSVNINANNLTLETGEFGGSSIRAGITADSTSTEEDAGDITINATDNLTIDDSTILNRVDLLREGDAGNIKITTGSLNLTNGGRISATTAGEGNAGGIEITATDSIIIDGESDNLDECVFCDNSDGSNSGVFSLVDSDASGNGGEIKVTASSLMFTNGGRIDATTSGQGDAGNINLNIQDNIEILSSEIFSNVESGAAGSAGNIEIKTNRLLVQGGGLVTTAVIENGSGRGGNLTVNASESIEIIGTTADGSSPSGLSAETRGSGIAGNLEIATGRLSVRDGGTVKADTADSGRGGNLTINASEMVEVLGGSINGQFSSSISADTSGSGDAGNITVTTQYLVTEAGGFVGGVARMGSTGNAGNLTINASDSIELIGRTPGRNFPSGISASVLENASGDGGNVSIETQELRIRDGAGILVSNLGRGQAGTLEINATDSIKMFGSSGGGDLNVSSGLEATGQGGNLTIQTGSLSILDGSQVLLATFGKANAGTLKIKASDSIEIMGMSLDTQLPSQIVASSGIPISFLDDSLISLTPNFTGEGGNITLQTSSLVLRDGGQINASAYGSGDAGSIFIDSEELLAIDSDISTATFQSSGGECKYHC
ncbi:MAG: filamentous hemagglutinin N-terminal domain-containing protein [Hyellaceae cyanobacterium CSU_1_1]|nr:filamentous hemagglutinin N-terminal domain-containing protein [Hyellaceae cyanobacterium CSU_1_1]